MLADQAGHRLHAHFQENLITQTPVEDFVVVPQRPDDQGFDQPHSPQAGLNPLPDLGAHRPHVARDELDDRYVQRARKKTPLQIAIELGFHSLVEVLLKAGAVLEPDDWRSPMSMALTQRRFDLIKLLVAHGYDPTSIDMKEVFQTWDPEIMEYFIDLGADVEGGNPLAYALCNRIQTSLRILKRDRDRFPSFQEQANIALRHHAKEGNLKWVSLLLWAGADPMPEETKAGNMSPGMATVGFRPWGLQLCTSTSTFFTSSRCG